VGAAGVGAGGLLGAGVGTRGGATASWLAAAGGAAALESSSGVRDHEGIGFCGKGVCSLISDEGGHAGMLSVGGSGGHTSVSVGGAVVFSSAGGHVCCAASEAPDLSGLVMAAG